jgi:hypothetical protein
MSPQQLAEKAVITEMMAGFRVSENEAIRLLRGLESGQKGAGSP